MSETPICDEIRGAGARLSGGLSTLLALLASLAAACSEGPPCESGRYEFCFETFPATMSASTAENPETTVRFELVTEELEALAFLDVPSGVHDGTIDVRFRGEERDAAFQLSIGDDTFWGASGRIVIERHDDERIVGHGVDVELDESLRDAEDGDRLAYLARIDFDLEIDNTGD